MKTCALLAALVGGAILSTTHASLMAENSNAELSELQLLEFNRDWAKPHQGTPLGVPMDYSWARQPDLQAGNQPGSFSAMTGWGHVFWGRGAAQQPGLLEIRNFRTYLCSGSNRHWVQVQDGGIEGAEFRADFQGNVARKPARFDVEKNVARVLFAAGRTFHFWPAAGRARLPRESLCGIVVVLEARVVGVDGGPPRHGGGYLIGLGADYWKDLSSPWDNFKTNKGVALGRLKWVGTEWTWYGLSTASDDDLRRLYGVVGLKSSR